MRILVALLILVVLIAVASEIIFKTDIPRSLVIGQVEKILALRVSAKSLSTGWLGHTELHDVALGLPLSERAFVNVPVMKVKNSSLFGLLLGRSIDVQAIEIDQPTVYVWQDSNGQWNLQQVAEIIARAAGKKPAQESQSTGAPSLPKIKIAGATLVLTDNKQRSLTINPIDLDGYPESAVSWAYDFRMQPDAQGNPRVGVKGRVAPGGFWAHQLNAQVHDIGDWVKPFYGRIPDVHVDVQWNGQLNQSGVAGRLQCKNVTVANAEAYGDLLVQTAGSDVRLTPSNLLLKTGEHLIPDIKLASGNIEYNGIEVQIRQLMVDAFGGPARVDGTLNKNARQASLTAMWSQLAIGPAVKHSGNFSLSAQWPLNNQIQITSHLVARGTAPGGPFNADVHFGANGTSLTDFEWTVDAPTLTWHRAIALVLDSLHLTGGLHWKPIPNSDLRAPVLTLNSATLGNSARLAGTGAYNFDPDRQDWDLHLSGRNWSLRPAGVQDLVFDVASHGDKKIAWLDHLTFQNADATLTIDGTYTYGVPKPVRATVRLSNVEPAAGAVILAADRPPQVLRGSLSGSTTMVGTLSPLLLDVTGQVNGHEVDMWRRHIGDISLQLAGDINFDRALIKTQTLRLLDGNWDMTADYLLQSDSLNLTVGVKDLSLKEVGTLAGRTDLKGSLDGKWDFYLPALRFEKNAVAVRGIATLKNVSANAFNADQITATTTLANGSFSIDPIEMIHGNGRGQAHAQVNLNDLRHYIAGAELKAWPLDLPDSLAHVDLWVGAPEVIVDLGDPNGKTEEDRSLEIYAHTLDISGAAKLQKQDLGRFEVRSGVWGRMFDARGIHATLLGGRADGQARINLANFTASTAEITWENLNMAQLAIFFPELKDLRGLMNGNLRIAPAEVSRPVEPLAMVIQNRFVNGAWRTVPITDATIIGYIGENPNDPNGGYRLVLGSGPRQTSYIHADEGVIEFWGRIGRHNGNSLGIQSQIAFDNLELNTLVHAFEASAHDMPGKLSGNFTLLYTTPPAYSALRTQQIAAKSYWPVMPPRTGPTTAPTTAPTTVATTSPATQPSAMSRILIPLYGDGEVKLVRTNLAQFGPIAGLYNLMHLGPDLNAPTGHGNVGIHLERNTLTVTEMRYFNRGVEVRAVATVGNVSDFPDCPLTGSAVGSAQPLANTKLPLLADVNDILSALQKTILQSISIEGTVRNPKWHGILFGDIGGELQRMIVGDVRSGAAGAGE